MGYLEPQIFFSSPSCSFIVPLFWVFVSEWGLFHWLLDNQHSSISKWFSFSYTSEVSSFFCTQGDWPVAHDLYIKLSCPCSCSTEISGQFPLDFCALRCSQVCVWFAFVSHILARAKKAWELLQVTSHTTLTECEKLLMELLLRITRGAKTL